MAELEKENVALHQEIFHLRNQIADLTRVTPPSHLQGPQHSQNDDSSLLHESKRRKRSIEEYLASASVSWLYFLPPTWNTLNRPPLGVLSPFSSSL